MRESDTVQCLVRSDTVKYLVKSNKSSFVPCSDPLIIMRWHSLKNVFFPVFFLSKLFSCFNCSHMGHLMLKFKECLSSIQATIAMLFEKLQSMGPICPQKKTFKFSIT